MRQKLQNEIRNLAADMDALREQLEEEQESKSDVQRQLSKANNEVQVWRVKFESEGAARTEELMEQQRRLQNRLSEAESNAEAANSKASSIEKAKARLAGEMEDLMIEVERATTNANNLEKRQRSFDKTVQEWQSKVSSIQVELDNSQKEARGYNAELFRVKSQFEETGDTIESMRRENKNLAGKILIIINDLLENKKLYSLFIFNYVCTPFLYYYNLVFTCSFKQK